MNLATRIGPLELPHPFLLASGPLSHDGESIVRAHRAGAAAVVTKTISRTAAVDPVPHIVLERPGALLNAERWSTLSPSAWIEHELPFAKASGATVIASIGLAAADVAALASSLETAGADALEVVSYDEATIEAMVAEAVGRVQIPVIAKISVNWRDPIGIAQSCAARGAAAITASDSMGPALRIDVERRRPRLPAATAWLSGGSLFPIALHLVAQLSAVLPRSVPIIGTGGVARVDDAVEMLMAGATAIGMCTTPLLRGLSTFRSLAEELAPRLAELGFNSPADCVGAAVFSDAVRVSVDAGVARSPEFAWNATTCTHCNRCVLLCPYGARTSPDLLRASPQCRRCGLCVSACPTRALSWAQEEDDALHDPCHDQGDRR